MHTNKTKVANPVSGGAILIMSYVVSDSCSNNVEYNGSIIYAEEIKLKFFLGTII